MKVKIIHKNIFGVSNWNDVFRLDKKRKQEIKKPALCL
jgi:hypothetical protein